MEPGQTLALVGPDFADKNTVLSLVDSIDSSTPDTLLLDGIDICELNASWLRRQIGVVSKYPVLFNMSVLNNIRYGANYRYVDSNEVIEAAKRSGVHETLSSLSEVRISQSVHQTVHVTSGSHIAVKPSPLYNYKHSNAPKSMLNAICHICLASQLATLLYRFHFLHY